MNPPARSPVWRAALVVALGVSAALHVGKLPVAIPVLQQSLGLNLMQGGFLLSLLQLAGMTMGLAIGLLADRVGPRRVMRWGLLLLALGSAAGAMAVGVGWLLATRVLEGAGFLLTVLPAPALLRQQVAHPPTLARALGWWGAYMPLGTALALLLGAPLMGLLGWPMVWLGLALLSLAGAAALTYWVPAVQLVTGRSARPGFWGGLSLRLRCTLRAPGPWLLAIGFFLYSGQWLAVIGFLPTIYSQAGYGLGTVGVLTALAAGINMLGNISAGRLLARGVAPGVLLTGGYLAMALGALLAFAVTGQAMWQYAGVLLFSCLGGWIPGTLFGLAVRLAPGDDTVSTTVGWMQQFSSLGQFLGPPTVALVATTWGGWQHTWMVTGVCSLLGVWLSWRLQQTVDGL